MPFVADALHLDGPSQPQTRAGKGSLQLHRTTIFAIAWVLTLLTSGGLCFGFGPFYSRLVKEHQWHELCPDNTTSVCSAQEVQLQTVYSTGILMTVLVGDSRDGTDGLLVAGYALIGFGGMGILYASLQLVAWVYVSLGSMLFLVVIFGGGAMPSIIAASRVPANDSQHDNHDLQRVYTNYLYPLISNSSFLFSPLAGYLVVHFGFRKTFYTTIGIFALLCGSFMLPSLPAQNATFVLMAAANAFLTTMQYVYIST
ncbi:hypothetical protein DYB35_002765 [Aphanomyces astaci]|uniref:Uncharacterized protein n=1 Tax=Aphanomyces astaci TaxID=112090 RepID=A0A418CR35_APHAT|nr:hypothetical protein DYB35_002765 [Aphanomyces astaci]